MAENVIYTLNVRDNVMPEVLQDYFGLSPIHMMKDIQSWRDELVKTLSS